MWTLNVVIWQQKKVSILIDFLYDIDKIGSSFIASHECRRFLLSGIPQKTHFLHH